MGQNYSIGASFLNKHQEKEKIRSKEEADFVAHDGEIKTYKATKEEIDAWMEDLLLKKQGKHHTLLRRFLPMPKGRGFLDEM